MLSMILLSFAMLSAAWAYASMIKSGELTVAHFPMKYRIILLGYILLTLFILYAGGLIMCGVYVGIGMIGFGLGYCLTKKDSYIQSDDGLHHSPSDEFKIDGIDLRIPIAVKLGVDVNTASTVYSVDKSEEEKAEDTVPKVIKPASIQSDNAAMPDSVTVDNNADKSDEISEKASDADESSASGNDNIVDKED